MNYDTEGNGVIDLVQLLKDVLDLRAAIYAVAIDSRDADLATALDNGIDASVHTLMCVHLRESRTKADEAKTKLFESVGTLFDQMDNMSAAARAQVYVEMIEEVLDAYADAIEAMKGVHPMLFEKSSSELLLLLIKQEQTEAETQEGATASADATA